MTPDALLLMARRTLLLLTPVEVEKPPSKSERHPLARKLTTSVASTRARSMELGDATLPVLLRLTTSGTLSLLMVLLPTVTTAIVHNGVDDPHE